MLNNGIYKMSDYDNQETLFKIKESEKSITFELVGEIPRFTRGDMDMFIYNNGNKKTTIKKVKSGHTIHIIDKNRFVFYPYQSGNPYLFQYLKESGD